MNAPHHASRNRIGRYLSGLGAPHFVPAPIIKVIAQTLVSTSRTIRGPALLAAEDKLEQNTNVAEVNMRVNVVIGSGTFHVA
jgi:hypothetical protein